MRIKLNEQVSVVHNSRNVCTVYFSDFKTGDELNVMLRSDAHHDSVHCERGSERDDLDEIKAKNGLIVDVGDVFEAMQGKYDPRRQYSDVRPEYKVDNYLDEIVADASKFYAPYAPNFLVMSPGNHESSILSNNGVDLINNLVHRLNSEHGGHIQRGGYGGYIIFRFEGDRHYCRVLKYFHGAGYTNSQNASIREGQLYPDADIIVNGHWHKAWYQAIKREHVTERGSVYTSLQHHVRTATYNDTYKDGFDGWTVERGMAPSPVGCVLLKFRVYSKSIETEVVQRIR